jgi:hypothetical protein
VRDPLQHAVAIPKHIVVPEPQHAITLRFEKTRALGIVIGLIMAIHGFGLLEYRKPEVGL